jgi:hypothetical protein
MILEIANYQFHININCNRRGGAMKKYRCFKRKSKRILRLRNERFKRGFNKPVKMGITQALQGNGNYHIHIFQSEVEFITAQADLWNDRETGGELYGFLSHDRTLIIMLATPPGKNSIHGVASFQQDFQFFKRISKKLQTNFTLLYIGSWHSHHNLSLKNLSGLDIQNLNNIARKNEFSTLTQLLLTFENSAEKEIHYSRNNNNVRHGKKFIQIRSYYYPDAINGDPVKCPIRIIPGISPMRQAIKHDPDLSEIVRSSRFQLPHIIYDDYRTCLTPKNNIPNRIRDQINIFLKTSGKSLSISFEDKWIIVTIPLSDVSGFLFITFSHCSPFDINSIFYQADSISKNPVNISSGIFKNRQAHTSLKVAYDRSWKLIIKHFATKKRSHIHGIQQT